MKWIAHVQADFVLSAYTRIEFEAPHDASDAEIKALAIEAANELPAEKWEGGLAAEPDIRNIEYLEAEWAEGEVDPEDAVAESAWEGTEWLGDTFLPHEGEEWKKGVIDQDQNNWS